MSRTCALVLCTVALSSSCDRCAGPAPPAGGIDTTETSATIGAAGGALTSADGRLTLQVPPGALDGDVVFTMHAVEEIDGAATPSYEIGPDGTEFLAPVALTFHVPDDDPQGEAFLGLGVALLVDGAWTRVGLPAIDDAARTVTILTTHLSRYCCIWPRFLPCQAPTAPFPGRGCAIPCVDAFDCPAPLECIDSYCYSRVCDPDAPSSGCTRLGNTCTELHICTQECVHPGGSCPADQTCTVNGICSFDLCGDDDDCSDGNVCAFALCLPANAGCDSTEPACPTYETPGDEDGGAPAVDGGTPAVDGGAPADDGGAPPTDAGTGPVDAGLVISSSHITLHVDGLDVTIDCTHLDRDFVDEGVAANAYLTIGGTSASTGLEFYVVMSGDGDPLATETILGDYAIMNSAGFVEAPNAGILHRFRARLPDGDLRYDTLPGGPSTTEYHRITGVEVVASDDAGVTYRVYGAFAATMSKLDTATFQNLGEVPADGDWSLLLTYPP